MDTQTRITPTNEQMVSFFDFPTDQSQVAPVIFCNEPHYTTSKGIVIKQEISSELKRFLHEYTNHLHPQEWPCDFGPYFRIDAYFNEQSITILEVNTSFVDGWGTALNLSRASKIAINSEVLQFPVYFCWGSMSYLPELKLLWDELIILGLPQHMIVNSFDISIRKDQPTYHYERMLINPLCYPVYSEIPRTSFIPYMGDKFDLKSHLAEFSKVWSSAMVKIPQHYCNLDCSWQNLPDDIVLKFITKDCNEAWHAWFSVYVGKPTKKRSSLKRYYKEGVMLAQKQVQPTKLDHNNCQLIILAIGNNIIGGYVQYSPKAIITDDSVHGPLWIQQ